MTADYTTRVEQACRELAATATPVTLAGVAERAGIARATIYRRPELRAIVEEHRQASRDALTLSGLAIELDQIRTALEAVAAKVRQHEEELRKLRRTSTRTRD
jgi:AcrR family transcriptional regulator